MWKNIFPFIKFPPDWEIEFIPCHNDKLVHFCVRKEGAPNIASVLVWNYEDEQPEKGFRWEICVRDTFGDGTYRNVGWETYIPIQEVNQMLLYVEEKLHEEVEPDHNVDWSEYD